MDNDSYKQNLYHLEDIFNEFKDDMSSKGYEQYLIIFDYLQELLMETLYDYYYSFCLKESENNE